MSTRREALEAHASRWVEDYVRAWREAGTRGLGALFTPDAVYSQGPDRKPVRGLAAIAVLWELERRGPDEEFTLDHEVVATGPDVAAVRLEVRYGPPAPRTWRDLWILKFAADGRVRSFEEWPFDVTDAPR